MRKSTAIDQAFDRYIVLSRLIELEQERARANPQHPRYSELGITEQGDSKLEAAKKVIDMFDGLAKLIEHVAILDMAGSFERFFRTRIGKTVGEIRTLIKINSGRNQSNPFAVRLVQNSEDFKGLSKILSLIEGVLSQRVLDVVELVRQSRNTFAHGTDLRISPVVDPAQARDNLNEIAARL